MLEPRGLGGGGHGGVHDHEEGEGATSTSLQVRGREQGAEITIFCPLSSPGHQICDEGPGRVPRLCDNTMEAARTSG